MDERLRDKGTATSSGLNASPQRHMNSNPTVVIVNGSGDPSSPGDGEDGGFQERLIIPRKTSVETQTVTEDSYYQRKITPRVPKRK